MAIIDFPPVELADENGLLAVGGDLEEESLYLAYRSGIFPWPILADGVLAWFAPKRRAIVFLEDFHIPERLARKRRRAEYTFRIDTSFETVIRSCAESPNRRGQQGTWITEEMIEAYIAFHHAGWSHSIECFHDEKLVGGLYGVAMGKMFAGESMFYIESDASKLCLCFLVEYLRERGVEWFDCQQMTPLLEQFGAVEVDRGFFMELLRGAVDEEVQLF